MTGRILGLFAVAILLFAHAGYALEIIYPADHTYVNNSNYLIVKSGGTPAPDGLIVELNGYRSDPLDISTEAYRAAFGDMLVVEPVFDPGTNLIKVEGYVDGKQVSEASAEIFYQSTPFDRVPQGFERFVMHVDEHEQQCIGCHNMNPTAAELEYPDARRNPCGSCHARMLNKKHVHGPAGVFQCTYCHDSESRPEKYQVREGDALVCNECHEDKTIVGKPWKYVHGPVEAQMCLPCHNPHASNYIAQSHEKINDLCLGCHEGVDNASHVTGNTGVSGNSHPLQGPSNPASIDQEFNCASCHDPHGGNAKALFQKGIATRMQLCRVCHAK